MPGKDKTVKRRKTDHAAAATEPEASLSKLQIEEKAAAPEVSEKVTKKADDAAEKAPVEEDVEEVKRVEEEPKKTFKDLGVMDSLCEACDKLNFKAPTPIQVESIPVALTGKDLIALAETGSGKTAAFAIPILQALWDNPTGYFACVLAPTRELAFQIAEQFEALGGNIGVRCAVIVGGMAMMEQAVALGKKPHIIIATPGRLVDHLENTKGFSLKNLKYLVMDEADRLLDMDFGPVIDKILKVIPKQRNTYLFSATMTSKVEKLQRASLNSPTKVSVSSKYQTVSTLIQRILFIPLKDKDTYLVYLVNEYAGQTIIIFARTVSETNRLSLLLRELGFKATPLNGDMSQSARLGSLNKFKSGSKNILVATDVAARGLDIPSVDCVINFDLAGDSKTYIHRVGRTARAGRSGRSIAIVTQYDIELFLRIEKALGVKIPPFEHEEEDVLIFSERVGEAQREAIKKLKEEKEKRGNRKGGRSGGLGAGKGAGKKRGRDDREEE
ncbi:putative ATP-dependent rRNA helicase RRP3 [Pyronema domesticum]|uniref:ATP-dependent rRNA helicase RRP3 n=1 Tax=Pyronema omphalodes (strain CBS 100304) TaxID=1076935 RepID=U4LT81_PYROM|nr:putative ATP-dependent rRNA helicase RRP3 [Pyronema domesticum]CCX32670.1 Similar to ATP-dependent rRNA helicase rrp3; acc. no. Q9P6N8 [Pyronema omphalodes CBS 100304]